MEEVQEQRKNYKKGRECIYYYAPQYYGGIILLVASIFLIGNKMFDVSVTFLITKTMEIALFEDNEALKMIFYVGYITAAAVMLIPACQSKEWHYSYFVAGITMPLLSVAFFVIKLFRTKEEMKNGEYALLMELADVDIQFTGNAWAFLIVSLVAVILVAKSSKDLVNAQNFYRDPWC